MERAEWLKQMRQDAEALYNLISPQYWVTFGLYENETHRKYLRKFLGLVNRSGTILSAACGAGRYDGMLLEAGHTVVGIDQSEGMLGRARQRFPQTRYEKLGLQEVDFREEFDGVICIDAMEHVCPEDWPGIMQGFQKALRVGGVLYCTVEVADAREVEAAYRRAKERGLPVVFGEVVDELEIAYEQAKALQQSGVPGELADAAVYHYHPSLEQVREWMRQVGLSIVEEGTGSGYHHILARNET